MPGSGGNGRTNSERLRDEDFPWLWQIRAEWNPSDPIEARAATNEELDSETSQSTLVWVYGINASDRKEVRYSGPHKGASLALVALMLFGPGWKVQNIALSSSLGNEVVVLKSQEQGPLHDLLLERALCNPAHERWRIGEPVFAQSKAPI